MERIKFSSKSSLIDDLLETFKNSNDITVVVDKPTMEVFLDEYDDEEEFDYYALSIASDVDEFYITKIEDIHFSIIEAKYRGEYKPDESAKVIILEDVYDNEILDYIETKDIEIYGVDIMYEDLDYKKDEHECTCNCDCCDCYYNESREIDNTYFGQLNQAQQDYLFSETMDMIDVDLNELAKICLTFYNDGVNSTLLKTREILATLEK